MVSRKAPGSMRWAAAFDDSLEGSMKKEWKRHEDRNRKISENEYSAHAQKW